MATTTRYDRSESTREATGGAVRVAKLLCLAAGITALVAGVLLTFGTLSSTVPAARIAVLLGTVGFGWCAISLLLGAVVAAANAG